MTGYIVLKQNRRENIPDETIDGSWSQVGPPVEAVSAEAAIRKAVDGDGGTYVAVPVRSFAPVTVKVETTRKLTLA